MPGDAGSDVASKRSDVSDQRRGRLQEAEEPFTILSMNSRASAVSSFQESDMSDPPSQTGQDRTHITVGRSALPERIDLSTIAACPTDADGTRLSLGSALHDVGECTPCKFLRSSQGCKDGALCKLCHSNHDDLTRSGVRRVARRKGLQKRAYFESQAAVGLGGLGSDAVKNTFLHIDDHSEVVQGSRVRSRSSEYSTAGS
jgi:hypothetical protein